MGSSRLFRGGSGMCLLEKQSKTIRNNEKSYREQILNIILNTTPLKQHFDCFYFSRMIFGSSGRGWGTLLEDCWAGFWDIVRMFVLGSLKGF